MLTAVLITLGLIGTAALFGYCGLRLTDLEAESRGPGSIPLALTMYCEDCGVLYRITAHRACPVCGRDDAMPLHKWFKGVRHEDCLKG